MMILQLLNGDLFETECKDIHEARLLLSHHLSVPIDRIHITTDCNEHVQHLVFISPTPQLVIRAENIVRDFPIDQFGHYPFDTSWLGECVNQSILDMFRPHLRSFHNLFANPGMVEEILGYLSSIDPDHPPRETYSPNLFRIRCLNLNPHDRIVDFLFAHPHLIDRVYFKRNSNRRAVNYVLDHLRDGIEWAPFFKHPYPESVEYVWNSLREGEVKKAFRRPANFHFHVNSPHELASLPANDCEKANELRKRDFDTVNIFGNGCCQSSDPELLRKCIHYLDKYRCAPPHALLINPSPVVVEWLLEHPNILERNAVVCQSNPNDHIVTYFVDEYPGLINIDALATNPNPKAIQWVQKWLETRRDTETIYASLRWFHTAHIRYILNHPHSTNIKLRLSFVLERLSTVEDLEVILCM